MRDCPDGNLGARADAKLVENVLHVIAGGPLRDYQGLCDLSIGQPTGNQRRNFLFTGRERTVPGSAR